MSMFWFFHPEVQRTWRGFFRPIMWVVFIFFILSPFTYFLVDLLAWPSFVFLSALPLLVYVLHIFLPTSAVESIGSHFECFFWCVPVDFFGFFVLFIPWLLLVCLIFLPLLYFLRKR